MMPEDQTCPQRFEALWQRAEEILQLGAWEGGGAFLEDARQALHELRMYYSELERQKSDNRFRTIYDTAPVSIWQEDWTSVIEALEELRAQGVTDFPAYFRDHPGFVARMLQAVKILDVNQWTLDMFGARHKEEMLASLDTVFATPDTLPGFIAELTALAQGQEVFRTEMAVNTVQGDTRQILLAMSFPPRGSGSGQVLVSTIDITERVQAEAALRESEERLRQAHEVLEAVTKGTEVIVAAQDTDFRYIFFNEAYREEIKRLAGKDIHVGASMVETFAHLPEQQQIALQQWSRTLQGESASYRLEFGDPGHYQRVYSVRHTPIRDAQSNVVGAGEVAFDVTDQVRAEDALRISEERLSLAIEGAGMATWDMDLRTGRAVGSRRYFELLGYQPAPDGQATIEMWRSRVHPEDLDRVLSAFERARIERSLFSPEHRVVRADNGQVVWLRVFGRFLYDDAGEAVRFIGVFFDDTAFQEVARFIDAGKLARRKAEPPKEPLRPSGLEVIGAVPWGTHFCQFYATSQDLVETLVPYFRAGLEANEFCMWVTSAPLQVEQARLALRMAVPDLDDYLAKGQIEILDYSEWYTKTGAFNADTVLQGWMDKLAAARRRGWDGLRLTGNTFWLEQADWQDFTRYEEKVNDAIGDQNMIALCTYSLEKCGVREILDVIANHQFALIKQAGRWEVIETAEHQQAELSLRESEERLRLAMWAAELGVFEWDVAADRAVWENPRMYEIFGRGEADGPLSTAQLIKQIIHPDDVASFEAALAEGMKPGRLFHTICRIRRQNDGQLRHVEFSGRFERTPEGVPLRLMGVLSDITERVRAEQGLRESEERYRNLFNTMNEGFALHELIYDAQGRPCDHRFLQVNPAFERLTGLRAADVAGRTVLEVLPGTEPIWIERYGRVALTGEPDHFESYSQPLGRWYEVYAYCTEPGRFAVVFLDVTERKQAQEALRQRSEELEAVMEALPVGIAITDMRGGNIRANSAFEKVWGGPRPAAQSVEDYVAYQAWWADTGKALAPEEWASAQVVQKGEPVLGQLLELHRFDGSRAFVINSASPVRDASGKVIGSVVAIQDITDLHTAEQDLRESEGRLSRAQELAHLGSWELDPVNDRLTWSDETYRIFGLRPQEFGATYEAFLEAVHPEDRAAVDAAYSSSLREGKSSYEIQHRIVRLGTGEIRWVHEKCQHVPDATGKIIRSVGMILDITERVRADASLAQKAEELARSNKDLEQFAYIASHDLQEPLRMISSYVQLLAERYQGQLDDRADRYIAYAVDGANRMKLLINDLLAYSRVGTRGRPLVLTDSQAVLQEVLADLQVAIEEQQATVTHDALPPVLADEVQLGQLFQNLIGNALKFRGEAPPHIHVGVQRENGGWRFSVADNGIGLDVKYAERIFVIFRRLHGPEEYPGTGMGLAICKKIVERHGGRIWVESQLGQGATFYFTLPGQNLSGLLPHHRDYARRSPLGNIPKPPHGAESDGSRSL
jgi:PAS domain S-box-containing protein